MLGADHPDTLTSRNNLAGAYQAAGRLGEAIPLFEQTLADRERVLGADHPDTLTSRNNLAGAYQAAGRLGGRSRCTSRPWPTANGCWAPTTPTPWPRGTTWPAPTRRRAAGRGDPAVRADPGRPRAGAGRRPPRHPDLAEQPGRRLPGGGQLGEAIPLYEQTLADRERVLGADHPDTLTSRNNLADAYQVGGSAGRAIPLYEQTLADRERVLGADHPQTP